MGEHHKRSSSDFQTIIGVPKGSCCIKDACKAYKSMTTRWYPDKNSSSTKAEDVTKLKTLKEAFFEDSRDNGGGNHPSTTDHIFKQHQSVDDQFYMPSFHSRDTSRRSKTPSPMSGSLSRGMSRRSTNSSSLSEPQPLSRSISRMSNTSTIPTRQGEPSPLSRSISRMSNSSTSPGSEPPLSRCISRRSSTTPIMFSYSTARTKPPPVEKQLECTLEELLKGCTKKIKIKKDVITNTGYVIFIFLFLPCIEIIH
ncbi:uncharacterized protein LOC122083227 [Macadamia integrifolia]|uniref:uncharacterized protein LOC122083227 n=1 Tax=Macadamia integrifolia TaxID=60698 RepID=UPI001C4F4933|nr:uncharacterized protein LOC122083227 [Macadamia integrifolia]